MNISQKELRQRYFKGWLISQICGHHGCQQSLAVISFILSSAPVDTGMGGLDVRMGQEVGKPGGCRAGPGCGLD